MVERSDRRSASTPTGWWPDSCSNDGRSVASDPLGASIDAGNGPLNHGADMADVRDRREGCRRPLASANREARSAGPGVHPNDGNAPTGRRGVAGDRLTRADRRTTRVADYTSET